MEGIAESRPTAQDENLAVVDRLSRRAVVIVGFETKDFARQIELSDLPVSS
jgi:hypothetical protein